MKSGLELMERLVETRLLDWISSPSSTSSFPSSLNRLVIGRTIRCTKTEDRDSNGLTCVEVAKGMNPAGR